MLFSFERSSLVEALGPSRTSRPRPAADALVAGDDRRSVSPEVDCASERRARITALVAGDDRPAPPSLRLDVGDEDGSGWRDHACLARSARSTKHFWLARMVARMTSGGIGEESLVERAHQHHRPFDEAGDLLEQALVLDQLEALREGEVLGVGEDDVLAAVGVEHDLGLLQRRARSRRSGAP